MKGWQHKTDSKRDLQDQTEWNVPSVDEINTDSVLFNPVRL